MSGFDDESLLLRLAAGQAEDRRARPADFYTPHPGQLAFHTAPHRIRALFPGNRYGKTTAIGVEVNCVVRPDHRFGPRPSDPTTGRPAQVLWFCKDLRQFEILKPRLEEQCFDAGWKWNEQKHLYRWPHGAELWVVPGDRDWSYIQGINPDLICVDEECPLSLWTELQARGYGDRETRYVLAATATGGAETWMKEQVYDPWLAFHAEQGMDEDQAIGAQRHPRVWCLPKGGIADNPSLGPDKVAAFRTEQWRGGQKEWSVRNFGGFVSWTSDPVFDPAMLAWLRERRAALDRGLGPGFDGELEVRVRALNAQPQDLARGEVSVRRFLAEAERDAARGRVSVYEPPRAGRVYTLGFDTARGIAGRDLSVCSVFDKTCEREGTGEARQVCEAAGYWGGENFDRLVYALHAYYHGAFILGEAQDQGLAVLRRLVDDYGVRALYYDKSQGSLAQLSGRNPRLGWHRTANDVTLSHFQAQVRDGRVALRSGPLLDQMGRLRWRARSRQAERDDRQPDDRLVAELDGGGSPDLIMAAMYGVYALTQVHLFVEPPAYRYPPGTLGYDLGHNQFEEECEGGDGGEEGDGAEGWAVSWR